MRRTTPDPRDPDPPDPIMGAGYFPGQWFLSATFGCVDAWCATRYGLLMIKFFRHKGLKRLYIPDYEDYH